MRKEDIFDRVVSVSWLGWFRPIYYKYREMWLYALFGLGTVLINLFVYSLFTETIDLGVLLAVRASARLRHGVQHGRRVGAKRAVRLCDEPPLGIYFSPQGRVCLFCAVGRILLRTSADTWHRGDDAIFLHRGLPFAKHVDQDVGADHCDRTQLCVQ